MPGVNASLTKVEEGSRLSARDQHLRTRSSLALSLPSETAMTRNRLKLAPLGHNEREEVRL